MADVIVKHAFVSAVAEGTDATKVRTSNWNAAELLTGGTEGDVAVRRAAAATGAAWEAPVTLRTLFTAFTPVATTGLVEETLMSYTLPANTLAVNGRGVRLTVQCIFAANANTKTATVYFGATGIALSNALVVAPNGTTYGGVITVHRLSATTQTVLTLHTLAFTSHVTRILPVATPLTNDVLIKITGLGPTTIGDITATLLMVEAI